METTNAARGGTPPRRSLRGEVQSTWKEGKALAFAWGHRRFDRRYYKDAS